jgi:uncharacterized membrane protein YgaE (UPF0421/DUF939 family)
VKNSGPARWLDQLLGWCLGLLLGAVALALAVHLLESIWPQLLIACAVAGLLYGAYVVISASRNRW